MTPGDPKAASLDAGLSATLRWGTRLGVVLIALGLLVPAGRPLGAVLVMTGVGVFILLPAACVALMSWAFAMARDHLFMGIAGLVLAIMALDVAMVPASRPSRAPSHGAGPAIRRPRTVLHLQAPETQAPPGKADPSHSQVGRSERPWPSPIAA